MAGASRGSEYICVSNDKSARWPGNKFTCVFVQRVQNKVYGRHYLLGTLCNVLYK